MVSLVSQESMSVTMSMQTVQRRSSRGEAEVTVRPRERPRRMEARTFVNYWIKQQGR